MTKFKVAPFMLVVGLGVPAALIAIGTAFFHRTPMAPLTTPAPQPPALRLPWDRDSAKLPTGGPWQPFAAPLAIGATDMLLFERSDKGDARIWHIDWKNQHVESMTRKELNASVTGREERYTALWNKAGLWLIGPTTELIQPDGRQLLLQTSFEVPLGVPVTLDLDDSILVFHQTSDGKSHEALQIAVHDDHLQVEARLPLTYPGASQPGHDASRDVGDGFSVAKLSDSSVLLMGGGGGWARAAILTRAADTGAWAIRPAASMPHERSRAVTTRLPDGRIAVAGGLGTNTDNADIYDPSSDRWTSLPSFPFRSGNDYASWRVSSLATTPAGDLVFAGHREPNVMVLHHAPGSATGFATQWSVQGNFPRERASGVVQALSNDEVVVAGGITRNDQGCCQAIAGFDKVSIAASARLTAHALPYIGASVAQRGSLVFAAGGGQLVDSTVNSGMRDSRYAEMIDLQTGEVHRLPDMPFTSSMGEARWLDADRVLVREAKPENNQGKDDNVAIYDLKTRQWSDAVSYPPLIDNQLLDATGNDVWLLSIDGVLSKLDLDSHNVTEEKRLPRKIGGGTVQRVSSDQWVLAGGQVPSEWVSVVDEACEAAQQDPCPERYAGAGRLLPSASYQVISFGQGPTKEQVSPAAVDDAEISATAITRDGTVYMLAGTPDHRTQRLVRGLKDPIGWVDMPKPDSGDLCSQGCALQVAADPRNPNADLVFFRQGRLNQGQRVKVWLWNPSGNREAWQLVLSSDGADARTNPQPLLGEFSGQHDRRVMSMGWHLDAPILWLQPELADSKP